MSVLQCSRKNCENVMCDDYIPNIGYICSECLSELIQKHGEVVMPDVIEQFLFSNKLQEPIDLRNL